MTTTNDAEIERCAGAPASRAGKREAVLRALAATADRGERRSDRAIAKLCGVSQPFVSKLRRSLDAPATKKDTIVSETDVHAVLDDSGVDPDVAADANNPLIETREAHARLMADSVRGATLLPGGDEPNGAGGALPSAPTTTFLSLMGIVPRESRADDEEAPRESHAIIVDADVPTFEEEERDTEITVVTRPTPRAEPDTRTLQEQTYADHLSALRTRLQREQLQHGRLVEKVARGTATDAELAQSRHKMRATKDALEDAATLLDHARIAARERAERTNAIRYHETIDRTASELAQLVATASDMDRLVIELGAARERYHALLGGGLVDLRNRASKLGGQRRALEALTVWTSQGEGPGLEHLLEHRLRAVGVLRTQRGGGQAPPVDQLAVWAEEWTGRAIAVAREHAPAIPELDADAAEDTDAPSAS